MKKYGKLILTAAIIVALLIIINVCFFIVEEGYQAITIRFGKLEEIYTKAGLKVKLPWDEVKVFSKKILAWDGDAKRIPTEQSEAQFIWVDTTARWKIVDVKRFYEKLGDRREALKKMDDLIDSAVKTVISSNLLLEAVRSTKTPIEFSITDFQDLSTVLGDILEPKDSITEYINNIMTESEKADITVIMNTVEGSAQSSQGGGASDISAASKDTISYEDNKALSDQLTSLVRLFNRLLDDNNFYNDIRFDTDKHIAHTKSLLSQESLTPEEARILNRLLLESSFSQSIIPSPVKKGRETLSAEILSLVKEKMQEEDNTTEEVVMDKEGMAVNQFGIEMIDIFIRQIKYSEDLTESVFNRMMKERNQIAEKTRAEGEKEKKTILGRLANDVKRIESQATREAEEIKGKADAEATKIYADAYQQNPEFFKLWRTLESYKTVLPRFKKILSTDAEYFNYLYNQRGN